MKVVIRNILIDHNDDIVKNLFDRMKPLLPNNDISDVKNFAQQIVTTLNIYYVNNELKTSINHLKQISNQLSIKIQDTENISVKGLLLSRYILLSLIVKYSPMPVNSLKTFTYLNDSIAPLLIGFQNNNSSSPSTFKELLPQDLPKACELGLLVVDFADVGLFMLDRNLNVIFWNKGMERLYKLSDVDILGQNVFAELPFMKEDDSFYKAVKKTIQLGIETEIADKKIIATNNEIKTINLKIAPLKNIQDEILGTSILVYDLTERTNRELALKKYEQYFENILNDAADAIIILDENDNINMWNKAAETLFGWEKKYVTGKPISIIVPRTARAVEQNEWIRKQVKEKGFVRNYKTQVLTNTEDQVTVEVTQTAIKNETGDYIGSSKIYRDVTQQEKFRDQLIHSEKLSAVGTLVVGIAHEVGKPLTAISAIAQLLKSKTTDPYFNDKISIIQQQIDRISRTVRTLVDFSKPIAQKVERIYLNNVIEQVFRIIKYDKRLKYYQMTTDFEAKLPLVNASFDQILQVFVNMCLNAADAMEGKKDGTLKIRTWSEGLWVFASISDNGPGIPEASLPRIFEPFFTTKEKDKGTGLGLWVSYNIIKSFYGQIQVDSKAGKGTTFTIALPAVVKKRNEQNG